MPPQNRARHGPATEPRTLLSMPPPYAPIVEVPRSVLWRESRATTADAA